MIKSLADPSRPFLGVDLPVATRSCRWSPSGTDPPSFCWVLPSKWRVLCTSRCMDRTYMA